MKTLVFAAMVVAAAHAMSVYDVVLDEWRLYKTNAGRHFRSSTEEYDGLQLFLQSKDLVAKHNERYLMGLENYHIALNQFADWHPFEAVGNQNASLRYMEELGEPRGERSGRKIVILPGTVLPENVDWNARGAVNQPMDQKSCGSCYAIGSTGALEAQIFMKYHTLPELSVQQILDCSKKFGNEGCGGGMLGNTFDYLSTTGLAQASAYPYENSAKKPCRVEGKKLSDKVKYYYFMKGGDEEILMYALAKLGPMTIAINASPRTFLLYKGGIYDDENCDPTLVHAVLLTGYGTDPDTKKDYWIIKNSWGTSWGENGFMRLARNKKYLCGINQLGYLPKLD